MPVGAQEGTPITMPGGLKVMPDGNDMDWQPAPASLPKGMMITLLAGDPAKPAVIQVTGTGPFGVQYINPADHPSKGHS